MSALREYLRNSLPGFLFRRWRDRRSDARLASLAEMESHGLRLHVAGMDLALKKYLAQGRYEAAEIAACQQHLRASDAVLEIGSAIGFVGLYCQKTLGLRVYTSVEANPQTAEHLRRNYALNGLKPDVRELALAESDGEIEFHAGPLFWADSAVVKTGASRTLRVKSATLKTLLAMAKAPPTALIIDVEGGELALRGQALPAGVRVLIIELHPEFIGAPAVGELITGWIRQGFSLVDIHANVHIFRRDDANR